MPKEIEKMTDTVREHHVEWDYILWGEDEMKLTGIPLNDEFFKFYKPYNILPAFVANILRIIILREHGGVYLDTDCECHCPIDTLMMDCDFWASSINNKNGGTIPNNIFATTQNGRMINCLYEGLFEEQDCHEWQMRGTTWFSHIVHQHINEDVVLYGSSMINQAYHNRPINKEAYITHRFTGDWRKQGGTTNA